MSKENQRTCVITTVHYCFDTRIYYRQIRSLSKKYVVDYYAPSSGGERNIQCSGTFTPLRTARSKVGRIVTQLQLLKLLAGKNYSLYHLHDPELIPLGLILKLLKKKVVFDVHENVLTDIKTKQYIKPALRAIIYLIFKGLFYAAQKQFDWFFLAESSYRKVMTSDKYEMVYNYPRLKEMEIPSNKRWPHGMVYVGSITAERGIWNMLSVFQRVQRVLPDSILHLIGPIDDEGLEAEITQWISNNSLTDNVRLYGRMPNERVFDIMRHNTIGLCLLEATFRDIWPTKLFEYMMTSLAVVASDFALWKDIIEESKCGVAVNPHYYDEMAEYITSLLRDEKRLMELGTNGLRAVKSRYNWTTEEQKLLNVYSNLVG